MSLPKALRFLPVVAILLAAGKTLLAPAHAGVVVLANRSETKVEFTMVWSEGEVRRHQLEPGELVPIPVSNQVEVAFRVGAEPRRHVARASSLHQFVTRDNKLTLVRVHFPSSSDGPGSSQGANDHTRTSSLCVIPVKLLVDDDEPAVRQLWEKRLRRRLDQAADVFERDCRARFKVVAVDTWDSDDAISDFRKSMREFEREVDPAPAGLAIGFTSQYEIPKEKSHTHLGGTRGALHTHILLREWSQHVSPPERLEALVHELGHFLGAAHSAEPTSVMRPVLGDRRSHARAFRIGFDPINALAVCLVAEELQARRVRRLGQLSPRTKAGLRDIYTALNDALPDDPAARQYLAMLKQVPHPASAPPRKRGALAEATRSVVGAIVEAARANRDSPNPATGDQLAELYVRRAAAAADRLPPKMAAKAFLLGLGIALDDSTMLRGNPLTGKLCRQVESDGERAARLKVLGKPTMRGRSDLAKHFALSAALAATVGPQGAELTGLMKELDDARGGTGFSFADLAADLAGTTFARHVRNGRLPLTTLTSAFTIESFMPEIDGLDEGLAWDDFVAAYGSADDERFQRRQAAIRERVLAMPGYTRPAGSTPAQGKHEG